MPWLPYDCLLSLPRPAPKLCQHALHQLHLYKASLTLKASTISKLHVRTEKAPQAINNTKYAVAGSKTPAKPSPCCGWDTPQNKTQKACIHEISVWRFIFP